MIKTKYEVTYFERDGEFVAEIPDIDGTRYVASTFEKLETFVRENIADEYDLELQDFDIDFKCLSNS